MILQCREHKYQPIILKAGEEREGGKASDSAVASSNSRRGGGVQEEKVGSRANEQYQTFELQTQRLGDPASDSRYERVQERTPKSPT